nr:MAG TPA: hypothetical protein [Caudoviricetes sp.]
MGVVRVFHAPSFGAAPEMGLMCQMQPWGTAEAKENPCATEGNLLD